MRRGACDQTLTFHFADDFGENVAANRVFCRGIGDEQREARLFLALLCMASCGSKSGKEYNDGAAIPPAALLQDLTTCSTGFPQVVII